MQNIFMFKSSTWMEPPMNVKPNPKKIHRFDFLTNYSGIPSGLHPFY